MLYKNLPLSGCRCLQGKLIKLFGKQLITKAKLKLDELPSELLQFPKIQQWLRVVGIRPNTLQVSQSECGSCQYATLSDLF